jgi:hypothetical protein
MIEPGFYERIDLAAMREANFKLSHNRYDDAHLIQLIEAALVGVQPATVEEASNLAWTPDDPERPDIFTQTSRRLVSEWKPVGSLSKGDSE